MLKTHFPRLISIANSESCDVVTNFGLVNTVSIEFHIFVIISFGTDTLSEHFNSIIAAAIPSATTAVYSKICNSVDEHIHTLLYIATYLRMLYFNSVK